LLPALSILLFDPPFQHDSDDHVYEIAQAALRKGVKVNIFLMMDGVYNSLTSQNGEPFHMRSVSEKLAELLGKGVRIVACRVCSELRGVKQEMVPEGVEIGGIYDLADMIAESDVVINFVERN
jgi:sulfur relay (sulfurtransferase) complex TusBCD TusD component (DsrE family)